MNKVSLGSCGTGINWGFIAHKLFHGHKSDHFYIVSCHQHCLTKIGNLTLLADVHVFGAIQHKHLAKQCPVLTAGFRLSINKHYEPIVLSLIRPQQRPAFGQKKETWWHTAHEIKVGNQSKASIGQNITEALIRAETQSSLFYEGSHMRHSLGDSDDKSCDK